MDAPYRCGAEGAGASQAGRPGEAGEKGIQRRDVDIGQVEMTEVGDQMAAYMALVARERGRTQTSCNVRKPALREERFEGHCTIADIHPS
ncbi:MAG: hypothetical protein M3345_06640 [Actinomycetota bacterium]|nr:hypothetical protein [Actinomycetota bacterium]